MPAILREVPRNYKIYVKLPSFNPAPDGNSMAICHDLDRKRL